MSNDWPKFEHGGSGHSVGSLSDVSPQALGELSQFMQQQFALQQAQGLLNPAKISSGWKDHVVSWTSSGTAPAKGDGTFNYRYVKMGSLVVISFKFTFGASSTFGTGNYSFSLPVTAGTGDYGPGPARLFDSSSSNQLHVHARVNSSTTFWLEYITTLPGAASAVGQTAPWTWATSDSIDGTLMYEAA